MNINEMSEDLEQQFGKPRNVTQENVRFMLSLVQEQDDGKEVNEDVPQPSLDALGMTVLAVMSYQTTPWEELAKKPAIRRSLKYIAVRSKNHYDEVEELIKGLMRVHTKGLTQKMVFGFIKIIRALNTEEQPGKLIEYTPFPAHYEAILQGFHSIINCEHPEDAASIIHCAIDDGIIYSTVPRALIVAEFNLKKSSYDKYFSRIQNELQDKDERVRRQGKSRLDIYRKSLRNAIGYTVKPDDDVYFYNRKLGRKNFFSVIVAYCRSILRS